MPRKIIPELERKKLGGIYVISVPYWPKKWVKVGMAVGDISRRLREYSVYYPKNYWVHALLLYPNSEVKHRHVKKVEKDLHELFKPERIFGYENQTNSEWFSLTPKDKKKAI